ncbi:MULTISPECIES: LysM peptidoglycan-binding domain-containing protein [Francisella]|uniref:LysM peptidoglycan-binding domain-containing protein n=1 Tax=Francisella marina TaxID=2249302 RepID=A0ABX5ZI45_9GAMM|nr:MULTISPECIES: LysM peptidoglycan-binding domain-containing protein [Francisella]QEO57674.1 LysM peptidoglycan-binding domain-containing protein [Francisella marina]QEO60099.1 LysM peptidoglycan-binding domain-containing protein [Francisella marina]
MFKGINKILAAGCALVMVAPAFAMEIYTVKSNDYLYKIAKSHSVSGVSTSELTDAIKGINKSEIPGIVDNRIKIGDKLAIPTTKGEVEDGLTLTRNRMIQGSYNQPSSSNDSSSTPKLGDQTMVSTDSESDSSSSPNVLSEDKIPTLIPGEENAHEAYKSNLDSQISSANIQENESYEESSFSFLGSLFKFIVYIVVLAVAVIVGRRFWETRNSKKEQELEIISRKKRDHLMSRISPVVSGNEFYSSRKSNSGPQEEFDFFDNANKVNSNSQNKASSEDFEHELNQDISENNESAEITNNIYSERDNVVVKTERGVVFETNTDEALLNADDESKIQELDSQEQAEQELQYVNELVEQFLDSEKYVEASITIQDSLEKNPNNIDLRYKLLEVYAQAGDEIAFEGEVHFIKSKNIVSMFDPLHQKIAKLRDKYFE